MTMASRNEFPDSQSVIPALMGRDRNVTFVLDTSESMTAVLGTVKYLIIQTLLSKASLRNSLFNINTFSYKVTPWSDHMIPCAPDTVYEALGWIHALRTSPGNDLLTALTTAFSDPICQAVHLVTNSLPDNPERCLNALSAFQTRPVHTFYISEKQALDSETSDFLKCFTSATRGSCYKLSLNLDGTSEQVVLLHSALGQNQDPSHSEDRGCQALCYNPTHAIHLSPYWCCIRNPFTGTPCVPARVMRGAEFFPGCRVLARKEADGFYYLGTIVNQLQDRGGMFMVAFDKPVPRGDSGTEMAWPQLTCQPDMVSIGQAHGRALGPGDTVLAPVELQLGRYGPGRILSGTELRDPLKGGEGNGLLVLFWNGVQMYIPINLAMWIPASHHERIVRELQPCVFKPSCLSHAHYSHINWTPPCCIHQGLQATSSLCACPIKSCHFLTPCLCTSSHRKEVLETKCDQLKELKNSQDTKTPLCSSSPSDSSEDDDQDQDDEARKRFRAPGSKLVSRSVNTDISCLKKAQCETQSRPAWRYWRRGASEPHHKQPGRPVKTSPNINHTESGNITDLGIYSSISTPTNHSSLFKLVPDPVRAGKTGRMMFGCTGPEPPSEAVSPLTMALNEI
ncbi:uncharacterized protein C11orf16 homolog [Brachyhypopomus gauderio]|uniref:uncharacterized protein C11orf16 homolog n=1 Tax=Brachyhypopomus gauderio TaxID=698409 RepID=UPI004042F315